VHLSRTLTGITLVAGLGALTLMAAPQAGQPGGQAPAGQKQKQVKDQQEYDLFNNAVKATDPNKKIELLLTWKQKYPESDFKDDRQVHLMETYAQLSKFTDAIGAAKDLLAMDPKNLRALFYINNLTPIAYPQGNPPPDALDTAEKAANGLINAEMPPGTKAEDWAKAKADLEVRAHKTLGWVAWQRKNWDVAEQAFTKSLQIEPNQGETAAWMGSALVASRNPEKQAPALYAFARAVVVDPTKGGLPEPARKAMDTYLTKVYRSYHGSDEGLDQLKEQAKASALPPAGFSIKTAGQIAAEQEEELKKTNPQLALWLSVKKELAGANGEQYFSSSMKGAALPKLKGTIIEAKPEAKSKELVLGVQDPKTPEVTLRLDAALTGKPKIGTEVEFEGVPEEFTKDPFMVTIDVEKAKLTGLQTEAPPPAKRPVRRKGATKKK